MGEYAIRKSDGQEIKIGTCESMYYMRWEQKDDVVVLDGNVDPNSTKYELFFRIPFPEEDNVKVGDYTDFNKGLHLYKLEFSPPKEEGYSLQLKHPEYGILASIKCPHGGELPSLPVESGVKLFYNGKCSNPFTLMHIKTKFNENKTVMTLKPIIACSLCGWMWRFDWEEILPLVDNPILRKRLENYSEVTIPVKGGLNARGS